MKEEKKKDIEEYSIEEEEERQAPSRVWKLFLWAMVAPGNGWRKIQFSSVKPEEGVVLFLLPLSIIAALSDLFDLLYEVGVGLSELLVEMVVTFFSFFLGYYICPLLERLFMPGTDKDFPMSRYGKLIAQVGVGSLAIYHVLNNLLPMFDFIIEFFPLWTIFMIYKGMELSHVDAAKATYSMGVMCVVVICSPMLIKWIFSLF